MLKKSICALVAIGFLGFLLFGANADDPFVGTWKFNLDKSKSNTKFHEVKNMTLVIAVEGETTSVTLNGTDPNKQPISVKYTVPSAGGPLSYTEGAPLAGVAEVAKEIDDRTVDITSTMNGKLVGKQHVVVSPDHKTMTIQESGLDDKGNPYKSRIVYDRQ